MAHNELPANFSFLLFAVRDGRYITVIVSPRNSKKSESASVWHMCAKEKAITVWGCRLLILVALSGAPIVVVCGMGPHGHLTLHTQKMHFLSCRLLFILHSTLHCPTLTQRDR